MASLTHGAQVGRLEVVDTGRRRRWSEEEKLRIVAESFSGRRLVSSTARRHGISTSLLFTWRRTYRYGITDYFVSIPYAEFLKSVARRILDRHVLHLIKMWLTSSFWSKTSRVERQPPLQNPDSALARADRPLLAQGHKARDVL